jgi:tyrosinase
MKRRQFLNSAARLTIGAFALRKVHGFGAQSQTPLRKSINGLSASDPLVKNYAKAVSIMKNNMHATDPRNWTQQAKIHNDFCPHDNWWFLPWHRAYLFYFENVCRDVLQDPSFALPYWDWTQLSRIPDPFLDQQSPLWDGTRDKGGQIQLGQEIVGSRVISGLIGSGALVDLFSSPTSGDAQREHVSAGTLEGTPHNGVHGTILGDMGAYMSPLDPIFWLHHCNVDRIWASWAKQNNNLAPSSTLWTNHSLKVFYNPETKQQISPKAGDTLDPAKYRAIYDSYETVSTPPPIHSAPSLKGAMFGAGGHLFNATGVKSVTGNSVPGKQVELGFAEELQMDVSHDFAGLIQKIVSPPEAGAALQAATYLQIKDVPSPTTPSTALRVFLNCKNPSLETSLDDPTYVTTVAFFGGGHAGDTHPGTSFTLNVTRTIARVVQAGIYAAGQPIDVAILPVDLANPGRTAHAEILKPGSVQLVGLQTL